MNDEFGILRSIIAIGDDQHFHGESRSQPIMVWTSKWNDMTRRRISSIQSDAFVETKVFSNTTVCLGKELVKRFFFGNFQECERLSVTLCVLQPVGPWEKDHENSEGNLKSKLTKIIMMIATTQYKTRFYQITEKSQIKLTTQSFAVESSWWPGAGLSSSVASFAASRGTWQRRLCEESAPRIKSMWKKGWNAFLKAFLKRGVCNVSFVSTVFSR